MVVAHVAMARMAYIAMAYMVLACIAIAHIDMVHIVVVYIVMASMVMACTAMALPRSESQCFHAHRHGYASGQVARHLHGGMRVAVHVGTHVLAYACMRE